MNCKDFEKLVWVHDGLTEEEQVLLSEHLDSCSSCRRLFDQTSSFVQLTRRWAEEKPCPENSARLTHSIMDAVKAEGRSTKTKWFWIDSINTSWVRFSMASFSLMLIITFFREHSTSFSLPLHQETTSTVKSEAVLLNSSAFIVKKLNSSGKVEQQFSLLGCIRHNECPKSLEQLRKQYQDESYQ